MLPNTLESGEDYWSWNLEGNTYFTVAAVRNHIDHYICSVDRPSCWNKYTPKKVNIFVWRMLRNGLPTLINLFGRGVDVTTFCCKLCNNRLDDGCHLFYQCAFLSELRVHINAWLNLNIPVLEPSLVMEWYLDLPKSNQHIRVIEAIMFVCGGIFGRIETTRFIIMIMLVSPTPFSRLFLSPFYGYPTEIGNIITHGTIGSCVL
ncbi:Endonuclease/exonuclease/phosphatase [Artemisia annua]|uniref:Endonuclease/exonuclease/phosphatase n=1 Tax=Artemisia annua TaxID=35608 RepID=A0A2U1Q0C6_ARTAN|nr:Endonuclease/exonuclease/phosphatase [Artemisia annua]